MERVAWRWGEVVAAVAETSSVRSLVLRVKGWPGHRAGQHVDVRLTAEDGYQAQRSYSIASAPVEGAPVEGAPVEGAPVEGAPVEGAPVEGGELVALTVERLAEGEVSPFLVDEVRVGDRLEVRGPIGSYFTWTPADGGPLFLVAGGSGIVPLMAMLRYRALRRQAMLRKQGMLQHQEMLQHLEMLGEQAPASGARVRSGEDSVPAVLLYSSRTYADIIYRDELAQLAAADDGLRVVHTLTRGEPSGWTGYARRIDRAMLAEVAPGPALQPLVYVCGPTALVETVANTLVELGHDPQRVKTERFGPTG